MWGLALMYRRSSADVGSGTLRCCSAVLIVGAAPRSSHTPRYAYTALSCGCRWALLGPFLGSRQISKKKKTLKILLEGI